MPFRRRNGVTKPKLLLWALKDVSLEIGDGDVVGLIGRNGSGKSTLLKILSRITESTSGHAKVRGRVGKFFETLPDHGKFICRFDRFPLLPETYSINLYTTVNGVIADWGKDAARVSVEDGDFFGTGKLPPKGYGSVTVAHDWDALPAQL